MLDWISMDRFLDLGAKRLELGKVTHVMGVINVSPDSKNVHTVAANVDDVLLMAERYRDWGASVLDLGGQSSHYDNDTIDAIDEISRVVPAIEALVAEDHIVAIDTWKAEVAEAALAAGALIVNDTGGLKSEEMREVVARFGAAAIAVYVEGDHPHDVGSVEIRSDKSAVTAQQFERLLAELTSSGIENVILDPGIALNYRGDYDQYTRMQLEVIAGSDALRELGKPVLIPIPRKRDFHRVVAYMALALEHQADLIRVHDVAVACDLARLFDRGI
ncbi:MAG: dihydropteroate synthase [Acidimicrobiia bacterium]|nr:dihydropteroate synthase [Acidimicrobiia bacterium]MDH3463024.1 dihydropteroate synthase [Acidimicrobiia bacterium]